MKQRTDEWHQARLGKITGSRVNDVIRWSWPYAAALIMQRATGKQQAEREPGPQDPRRGGIENEPVALGLYGMRCDQKLTPCGFITHPRMSFFGSSPDGLVALDGVLEIKCPSPPYDMQNKAILEGIPSDHLAQCLAHMSVTERSWCDFVSYAPGHPVEFHVKRLMWESRIITMERQVMAFELMLRDKPMKPPLMEDKLRYLQLAKEMFDDSQLLPSA